MKVIFNNIIPFKGFLAINIFGILYVRKDVYEKVMKRHKDDGYWDIVLNHEEIHTKQMKELLFIFFYLWYFIEWLIKCVRYFDAHKAYRMISFEQEAYKHEKELKYLENRKHYDWIKYVFH